MASTRVYQFGLLPPTSHADEIRDLMRTAHRYRNTHVEIERGRRAAVRALLGPHLLALETDANDKTEAVLTLVREIKDHKARERTNKIPPALAARLTERKGAKKDALQAFYAAKKAVYEDPLIQQGLAEINARGAELGRNARHHSGLAPHAWGTYQRVEAAADQSRRMPLYDGTASNDPDFQRWSGEGSFAIHLQGDNVMPVEELFAPNPWVHVAPVDPRAWLPETSRSDRRRLCHSVLHVRLGTDAEREPILATLPILMHREIPAGSRISWAVLQVRKHGPREEWSVAFTVTLPGDKPAPQAARGPAGSAVALDLGWRVIPGKGELRVCSWHGTDGASGELRLDPYTLRGPEISDGIRSHRDLNFDVMKAQLGAFVAAAAGPAWLLAATKSLDRWKSPARLVTLARRWETERAAGAGSPERATEAEDAIVHALQAWCYRDHHLWEYEAGQRRGSLRHRKEIYRRFGADLARRYATIVFEDFDLRRLARRKGRRADEVKDAPENETACTNRFRAATSELRSSVLQAFQSRGGSSAKVEAFETTHICHVCGNVQVFDAAALITWVCDGCQTPHDQDDNAARVLLERWSAAQTAGGARAGDVPNRNVGLRESRWTRIKREKAEREAAREGARNVSCNGAE
jgi:hypothetical protein